MSEKTSFYILIKPLLVTLVTSLAFFQANLGHAQQDTIWRNDRTIVGCTIEAYDHYNNSLNTTAGNFNLNNIAKLKWGDLIVEGDIALKSIPCEKFPFIQKSDAGYVSYAQSFSYQGYPADDAYYAFKEALQSDWGISHSMSVALNDEQRTVSVTTTRNVTIDNPMAPASNVSLGIYIKIEFEEANITWESEITEIGFVGGSENPREMLFTKYLKRNGKPRTTNFEVCVLCNNEVAKLLSEADQMLQRALARAQQIEWLREFKSDFQDYIKSGTRHSLEGIWSADITLPDGGMYRQAFDVAIYLSGNRFTVLPITLDYPSFDNSIKYLEPTAEPSIFLLTADYSGSKYEANSRFNLKSPALAEFVIQVPEPGLMNYLKANNLKYVGNRSIRYSLVKKSITTKKESDEQKAGISLGTGFAISNNGLIATNHHVVKGGSTFTVRNISGKTETRFKAEVIAIDASSDLAILKVSDPNFKQEDKLPYKIADEDVSMGTKVYSLGFPNPSFFKENLIVTDGIISSTSDEFRYQMTVPLTYGNSGGPIFNESAEIVGVSVAGVHDLEKLAATYSVKSKHLINLLKSTDSNAGSGSKQTDRNIEEQINGFKKHIYIIEVEIAD